MGDENNNNPRGGLQQGINGRLFNVSLFHSADASYVNMYSTTYMGSPHKRRRTGIHNGHIRRTNYMYYSTNSFSILFHSFPMDPFHLASVNNIDCYCYSYYEDIPTSTVKYGYLRHYGLKHQNFSWADSCY